MTKETAFPDTAPLEALISVSSRVVTISHFRPDGDAAGSLMACTLFLRSRGVEVTPVLPCPLADYLAFMAPPQSGLLDFETSPDAVEAVIKSADLIICLDFNRLSRTEYLEDAIRASKARKVLIDHHVAPDREDFDLVYSTAEVSSACELLYRIILNMPEIGGEVSRIPLEVAEHLYIGMMTDTNNFANSVSPSTFRMAADLLEMGVDKNALQFKVLNNHTEPRMRLMGHLLKDKMNVLPQYGAAFMILTADEKQEYSFRPGDAEGFVNLPLSIAGVNLSAFFTECRDEEYVRVSLRSRPGTDVNALARGWYNGGGHINAAGGRLFLPTEEIPAYFLKSLEEYFGK
ncbi:MAG: DHH family phosphoesterase [Bacteroidales bacterium]|nr:DHH family phosphoesterase [Bacteroidales bacterium]